MKPYIQRYVVRKSQLETLAAQKSIIVQNQEDPHSYCGLAAQYFVEKKTIPTDWLMVDILIPKKDTSMYILAQTSEGEIVENNLISSFARKRGEIPWDEHYLLKNISLPVSEQDLCGEKPRPIYRVRTRNK